MNARLEERIALFDKNNKIISKHFWYRHQRIQVLSSFIYTSAGLEADVDRLDQCQKILSKEFGFLSSARDYLELPIIVNMALSDDPEAFALKLKKTHELIMKGAFLPTEYEMLSALMLVNASDQEVKENVARMQEVYDKMCKNHPLLTGKEAKTSATILAMSGRDVDGLLDEMEKCFKILKSDASFSGCENQTMSALLAVTDGTAEEKCEKTLAVFKKLKESKMNLTFSYSLPLVAGLAAVNKPVDEIVEGVGEIADALKGKDGFGFFGLGAEGRTVYGIILYLAGMGTEGAMTSALLESQLLNVIIQELLMIMVIITTTTVMMSSTD